MRRRGAAAGWRMDQSPFILFAFGKAKPGPPVPAVPFWRAGAALHGRLQKIDVFLKANESFCPETVRAPAPNTKQLLGRQFQSTKGSGTREQSAQPPPTAPGDHAVPSRKSQQRIKHAGKKSPRSPARGPGGLGCGIPAWEVVACFVVAMVASAARRAVLPDPLLEDHFGGGCSSGFILQAAAAGGTCCAGGTASTEVQGTCPRGVTSSSPQPCCWLSLYRAEHPRG